MLQDDELIINSSIVRAYLGLAVDHFVVGGDEHGGQDAVLVVTLGNKPEEVHVVADEAEVQLSGQTRVAITSQDLEDESPLKSEKVARRYTNWHGSYSRQLTGGVFSGRVAE